ncbi:ISLre2 family transposase [Neomoorella thermoacetica]|uniref:ISLre2 family transposase n=1 Tax=Neomoorella thermoacetica TaxID=1525 RepID=UPI0008FB1A27|nr:ISLre2 family transposase [Moorella thermoacetica]OIQ61041.1 hypothetical protein MTIN_15680 [Moorella thermoacetica]
MEELIQHLWEKFLLVGERVLGALEGKITYPELEKQVKIVLNSLGKDIMKMVIESQDEYLVEHREARPGWVIERRKEEKRVITVFGEMSYERTYFYNKESQSYAHLADTYAGYRPHMRIEEPAKAILTEIAAEQSYQCSGKGAQEYGWGEKVSGQTVKNVVDKLNIPKWGEVGSSEDKRRVRYLYIEADEDHVARQDKKGRMAIPLIYVHEGAKEVCKGRRQLKEARYFSGPYKTIEDMWFDTLDYIENRYDLEYVERIYINGDGASWIRSGIEIIPKSVFILDQFHLSKYIMAAVGPYAKMQAAIWKHIGEGQLEGVLGVLREAEKAHPERRKAISRAKRYIENQWDGIEAQKRYKEELLGCSAEGHVSHILSARLSSRPGAWSKAGAEQMAGLRAAKANGVNIQEMYLAQQPQVVKALELDTDKLQQARKKMSHNVAEMFHNMPILNGPQSPLTRALRALIDAA